MPQGKSKKKKPAPKRPSKKTAKKKALKKKPVRKKTAKKKAVKKRAVVKKKAARKKTRKRSTSARTVPSAKIQTTVEPGPPPRPIPPVEEPSLQEEAIGTVTHYYSHLSVAVIQVNKGVLKVGDTIHIKGHVTDFSQPIESMEYEHQHINQASAGQSVGLKVKDHVREHDIVYRMK